MRIDYFFINSVIHNIRKRKVFLDFREFSDIISLMFCHKREVDTYEDDISTKKETEI